MHIDWWSLALQAVNFLVLIWLLQRFLYRPVRTVIEKRRHLAEQAVAETDQKKQKAETARKHFEQAQAALAKERQDILKVLHDEMDMERGKTLEKARIEANQLLEGARQSIVQERAAAVTQTRQQVVQLAVELASTLLGKCGSSASGGVFLEQLERQMANLPANELDRLRKDLTEAGACLRVVTVAPLDIEAQKHWTDRLTGWFGQLQAPEFITDSAILGGAELRFPHAVLKFTWADQLQKAKALLQQDDAAN